MSRLYRAVKRVSPGFVWRPLRRALHDFATEAGYHRERFPCDFRGLVDDPFEALERANGHRSMLEIPLDKCLTLHSMAYPVTKGSDSPYLLTARWILKHTPQNTDYLASPLAVYLRTVAPHSAADLLGIKNKNLQQLDPIEAELPWQGHSGRAVRYRRSLRASSEAKAAGFHLDLEQGWHNFGPSDDSKIEMECSRTHKLLVSVTSQGYWVDFSKPLVQGLVLVNQEKEWRFFIDGGNHRVAVLAALDFPTVPAIVRPDAIYWRSDAHQWPGVIAGDMDEADAINLFDRIFSGRQPGDLDSAWKPQAERFKREL